MKKIFFAFSLIFITSLAFGQSELQTEDKTDPCSSVTLKFKNYSLRNHQITVPNQMTINAVLFGTTTFLVKPGQQMMFSQNGENYPLIKAGIDTKKTESYNLNRLIKKRKKELGLR